MVKQTKPLFSQNWCLTFTKVFAIIGFKIYRKKSKIWKKYEKIYKKNPFKSGILDLLCQTQTYVKPVLKNLNVELSESVEKSTKKLKTVEFSNVTFHFWNPLCCSGHEQVTSWWIVFNFCANKVFLGLHFLFFMKGWFLNRG